MLHFVAVHDALKIRYLRLSTFPAGAQDFLVYPPPPLSYQPAPYVAARAMEREGTPRFSSSQTSLEVEEFDDSSSPGQRDCGAARHVMLMP